jgi:hypothetical protein
MGTTKPPVALRVALLVAYVGLIAVNVAVTQGLFGFQPNAQISDKHPTPITPAGWAFGIWGVIFLLQGAGVIYSLLEQGYENGSKTLVVNAVGPFWILGWIAECLWQVFFQWQTPAGMWICLVCLLAGLASFGIALQHLYRLKHRHGSLSPALYALYFVPTSINTAWLSVASSIGVLMVPAEYGHSSHELRIGAILLALLATGVGVTLVLRQRDTFYGLTLIWSLTAVYENQDLKPVGIAALICVATAVVATTFSVLRRRSTPATRPEYAALAEST